MAVSDFRKRLDEDLKKKSKASAGSTNNASGDSFDLKNRFNTAKKVLAPSISADLYNSVYNLSGKLQSDAYKIGGSQKIHNDGIIGASKGVKGEAEYYKKLYQANPGFFKQYMGEDVDWDKYFENMSEDTIRVADDTITKATARTGGLSSIDTSGMKKAEVNALGRMDNLSRRDTVYEKLQQNPDQEYYEHNYGEIFQGMSEKEYLDKLTAYYRNKKNQEAAQKKYDDWKAGADAETAKILAMPEYETNSVYKGGSEYLTPDNAYLEGYDHYTDANGVTLSAKQYRGKVVNETLAALVDAGNDPAKLESLRGNIEMLPELNNNDYNYEALPYMTDEQRSAFFTLYNSGKTDAAKDYLRHTLDYGLQAERVQTEQAQIAQDLENANWAEKALYSIGTVPQNLLNEAVGATQALAGIFNPKGLEDLHEYSAVYDAGREAQMVRGEIGQDIADATDYLTIPGTDINIPRMAYNAIMSSADSKANAFLFGFLGNWAPTLAMGSGAFANEYMNSQDYWDALVSMGIEAGTEYLPFDIMGNKAMKPGTKILSGMLAEGLGESMAEALNIGYDVFKNVENSETQQNIDMLISQGYTPEDAFRETVKKYGLEVLESGLTGALSGAGSNAPSAIQANIENRNWGKNIVNNEGADALMDLADTLPVNDQAKDIIRRMRAENAEKGKGAKAEAVETDTTAVTAEDVEASTKEAEKTARDRKEMSGRKKGEKAVKNAEVGYVYREVMRTVDAEAQNVVANTLAGDVALQLSESGFTGDVKKAARDIVNFISGKTDRQTMRTIEGSSEARRIALEYTAPVDRMMRAAERRSRIYELAGDVAQRARKDFVKPETTKAEKGAEEATKGIEDRAVITAADVEIADTPESTVDGKAVTIEGVANVSDIGTVTYTVKDSEGNTREVSEDDVSIGQNDAVTAVLVENARELGRNADAMIRSYVNGQDVQAYAEAFKQALKYGEDGRNLDVVKGYSEMKALNEGQIATAYEIGRGRRTFRNTRMVRKNTAGVKVGNVDTSQINMHDLNAAQLMSVRSMSSLAKAVGFNLKFVESKADAEGRYTTENGSWDPETLTLTLDVHAGSNTANDKNYAMMHTAGHELTHYIKQFAEGEMWNAYQEFVIGHLSTKDGKGFDLENAITAHIKTAREQGRYLDRDAAIEEVIANASGDALNKITEADLSALAQDNPGLFNKIKAFFDKWIRRLRERITEAYKGAEARTEEAQQMMDAVDEMGRRWNELLLNATKNRRESAKGENVASEATTTAEAEAPRSIGYRHIDQRTFDSVKEEDTELFASEVDEAQVGMAAAAKILLADLENSIPGQKVWLSDNEVTGQKRQTSALLGRMKDELGLTWDKLRQNLMQFSNMDELVDGEVKLPRNSATNRRIELYLNEMLTEGYTALDGTRINPWDEYFNAISGIEGADSQKKYSTTRGAVDFVDYAWPGEVKYSPRYVGDKPVVWVEDNILFNKPADVKMTDYIVEYITNHVGEMYTIIESGQHVFIGEEMPEEYVWSEYSKAIRKYNQKLFKAKGRAASGIGEAINIASNRRWEKTKHPKSKDAKYGMYRYDSRIAFPMRDSSGKLTAVKAYNVQLLIRNASDGNKYLYDVVKIKEDTITANSLYERETARAERTAQQKGTLNENIIRDSKQDVKKNQSRDLSNLSDRELLVRALETDLNAAERDHLERYKAKMDKLSEDQRKLEALNSEIVQLRQAGKTQKNSEELRKAMTNATTLRGRIDRTDAELNKIESAAMIKEIVRRNRVEASRSKATSLREWQEKEKYRKMLVTDAKKLHKWIVSPTSKGYTPEFMREPVAKFLETVDFTSKRALGGGEDTWNDQKFKDALEELRDAIGKLGNQQSDIDGGAQSFMGYIDLPANYVQNFNENISAIRKALDVGGRRTDTPVNRMTAAQMRELAQAFRVLNSSIMKVNTLVSNARYSSAKLAADETIDDMNELRARRKTNKALEVLNTTFNWKNTTPYYAFQRMGRGAKAIFESLQDGWDKMAQNSATVIEFSHNTFTAKESRTWAKEISEVKLDNGETIQMTTAQKMSLYCLSKRPQATGHLLGGGIRVADIEGKRGSKISQAENYTLTLDDIGRITGSLTDRQKEVADALQRFMSDQCAKWGNEISMKRFGFNQMTELFYFPIETDSNNRARIDETKDGKNSMFRLLNMSSLKPLTPNANNAIVIHDIFDVFAGHASDMAKYNALALPILDFIKWYNHVERTEVRGDDGKTTGQITTRSTQKALERAFGQDAKSYLTAFIKDLNAEHDGGRNDGLINSIVGRAKSAAVGANLRVYGLQITSLPRAAYAINPVYLAKGLAKVKSLNPVNAIKGTEAQQKVGILKWKDLGFYSTDIGRSTRGMVKREEGILGKIRDWSMAPAGWGDNWVSNIIYEAAKAEMKAKNPEIKPGSAEYDRRLNKRVREIVYKTQVVDSTMTRSDFMRSKGLASTLTAFMSEPTLTVNMLNESIQKAVETARKGGNVRDVLRASSGMAVRAATTFAVTACITSLVESMFDALRDDDEYETFRQKFMDALWGTEDKGGNLVENFNIFAMLPYIKDVISIFQGYENSSLITQGWQQVQDFKTSIESWQNGKAPIYRVVYNGAKAASSMGGIAVGNAMRDFVSMYNTFLAPAWGTPKLQTYEDNETTAATAYYEAIKAGDTELAEYYRERMDVTGMDMAKVEKKLATLAGDDFVSGGMTEAEARKWLTSEGGYDSEKADTKMRDLNFKKETGVNYSDFKSAYVAGTISKSEATRLLKKYREYDDNQVYFTLQEWDGGEDWTKYGNFLDAVDAQGNYAAEGKKLLDHGVDKSDIARAISTAYKDAYREIHGTYEGNQLLEYLLDVYEAIGYDRDYERRYITKNWLKD